MKTKSAVELKKKVENYKIQNAHAQIRCERNSLAFLPLAIKILLFPLFISY